MDFLCDRVPFFNLRKENEEETDLNLEEVWVVWIFIDEVFSAFKES